MGICVYKSCPALVPSIQILTEGRLTLHNEYGIPHFFLIVYVDVCTKLWWKESWHTLQKKSYFVVMFVTTDPN